jgi:hypothetical protein
MKIAPFDAGRTSARAAGAKADHKLGQVRLLAPIIRPGKYLAIGMNYKASRVIRPA